MKRLHIHNRAWFIIIALGWTAMLLLGAMSVHSGGWHHAWRHMIESPR